MSSRLSLTAIIISLLTITLVGGCSVASPNYYHISRMYASTNTDIILIDVQENYSTNASTLALSISSNSILTDIPDDLTQVDEIYGGFQMQSMTYSENTSGAFLHYNGAETPRSFSFDVTIYNINNGSSIYGLIYEKLDSIYIRDGIRSFENIQLIGSLSKNIIVNNGTNIFPQYLSYISSDLNVAITSSPDGGGMCGGPSYYKITKTGFDFLVSTVTGDHRLTNPISNNLHVLKYNWSTNTSTIQSFDIEYGSSSMFTITSQELENLLFNETTSNIEFLNYLGLFGTILVISIFKRNIK
ncbi:MAG: hypothetical protein GPJ54_19725 [Candidatus Heimdallarchaeota archaeon]|nr:hypothetical protein [Candidatus Heimdallarchaeota archaeon]